MSSCGDPRLTPDVFVFGRRHEHEAERLVRQTGLLHAFFLLEAIFHLHTPLPENESNCCKMQGEQQLPFTGLWLLAY